MAIAPGDTFILLRGTGTTPHLWVVLWGPAGNADAYLIVSLSTYRAHSDGTCRIQAGEHPFVQRETCVVYGDTRRTTREKLEEALRTGGAVPKAPVSAELLERIRDGALVSPYTPHAMSQMAVEIFGAERGA